MKDIYLALDFPNWQMTENFINDNGFQGVPVKIGMELFYREGPKVIQKLKDNNHSIFLDLKLHDIPSTVNHAMKNLAQLGVDMVNVHALGGRKMIEQAKEGLLSGERSGQETKLIAVTLLTSHDDEMMKDELLLPSGLRENVVHFASLSRQSGADGVVCSVHEASEIKKACGSDFLTVTPGIRLLESNQDDQKRIATPEVALELGADILVVGRSVTQAEEPIKAYQRVMEEFKYEAK